MSPLSINFVRKRSAWDWIVPVVLFGGVAVACVLAFAYVKRYEEVSNLERTVQMLRERQTKDERTAPKNEQQREQMRTEMAEALWIRMQLHLPWSELFRELENSISNDVTLLGVEPDPARGALHLTAEARNFEEMLAFEKRLRALPIFRDMHIVNHQVQIQDSQKPVRFVLNAQWIIERANQSKNVRVDPANNSALSQNMLLD